MDHHKESPDHTAHTLDPSFYISPDIFHRECVGLFCNTWQYAGHISQAPRIGDYFCFEIAGQSLFCLRQADETFSTFYNVCQHRAHALVSGSGQIKKAIVCPYHAWTYDLDGRFLRGPNTDVLPTEAREAICLSRVRTEVLCGFIFVNLDTDARPMDDWFPNLETELREFVPDIEDREVLSTVAVLERCNWKVSVENYSECYHCRINHRTFSTGVIKPDTYDIQPQGFCLRHTTQCQNLEKMTYPIDLSTNPRAGDYSSWYLWPTFSFQVYPGNILNTYHWAPTAVDKVLVTRGWYTAAGIEPGVINTLAEQDRNTTLAEDIGLVESQQRGFSSLGYRPGPLVIHPRGGVNSEHSIHVLQQWMQNALEN